MKKILTGTAIGLALAGLGGMLAGFTPSPQQRVPEVRGRILASLNDSRLPLSSLADDAKRWAGQTSGRLSLDRNDRLATFAITNADTSALLGFGEQRVVFLTEDGEREVIVPGGLLALLPLLPPGVSHEGDMGGEGALLASVLEVAVLAGDGEILNMDGVPLRWQYPQTDNGPVCFIDPLQDPASLRPVMTEMAQASDIFVGPMPQTVTLTALPRQFASTPMLARASRYHDTVERYAGKYNLPVTLVMAIMQTESGFNPNLVSSQQAHGLMQVVPTTAGDEVHRWMGHKGQPTSSELLNPDNNIRYGVAYLHLLRTRHLQGVKDARSLEYCVIASYNGGSGAVLRLFGPSKEQAFEAINALTSEQVLERLTTAFPARETRLFVNKVLTAREQFVMAAAAGHDLRAEAAPLAARLATPLGGPDASALVNPQSSSASVSTPARQTSATTTKLDADLRAQLAALDKRIASMN